MTDTVTILGRVAAEPNLGTTPTGIPVMNVRVASPQRRYDARTQSWQENGTNWYGVAAFRRLAEHAGSSLRVGDAVIVTGRLKVRDWEANGKRGTSVEIDADAIGHDLRWGTSAFAKAPRSSSASVGRSDGEAAHGQDVDSASGDVTDAWSVSLGADSGENELGDESRDDLVATE